MMRCKLIVAVVGTGLAFAGCSGDDEVGPEAILAGDWLTSTSDRDVAVVTFDSRGVVSRMSWEGADGTSAALVVHNAESSMIGDAVRLDIPAGDFIVIFEGTLSADQNTLSGTLTRDIDLGGDIIITIPQGPSTLHRVVDTGEGPGGDDQNPPGDGDGGGASGIVDLSDGQASGK